MVGWFVYGLGADVQARPCLPLPLFNDPIPIGVKTHAPHLGRVERVDDGDAGHAADRACVGMRGKAGFSAMDGLMTGTHTPTLPDGNASAASWPTDSIQSINPNSPATNSCQKCEVGILHYRVVVCAQLVACKIDRGARGGRAKNACNGPRRRQLWCVRAFLRRRRRCWRLFTRSNS